MARQLVGALIVAMLAGGCGKQLNATFCAAPENANDPDCRAAGYVDIDAPQAECGEDNTRCAANPNGRVCDQGSHTCVQCVPGGGGDISACTGTTTPVCGADLKCHGCIVDTDCPASRVCLPAGVCAAQEDVLYAQPNGTGTACDFMTPCTLTEAINRLTATRTIVKLTTTFSGIEYRAQPIMIATRATIIGTGTKYTPTEDGDAIKVTGGRVEIVGLAISGATIDGVKCENADLTLRRMTITTNGAYGVRTTNCKTLIERTRISSNPTGAMRLDTGVLEVHNNIIDKNGTTQLRDGNVIIIDSTGHFMFNTVADNLSEGGGSRTSGVACTGPGFLVTRNILAGNGDANDKLSGNCIVGTNANNLLDTSAEVRFDTNKPYHLSPMTPETNPIIRNDPFAALDCQPGGVYLDDFDGEPRPNDFCDRGADEYRP